MATHTVTQHAGNKSTATAATYQTGAKYTPAANEIEVSIFAFEGNIVPTNCTMSGCNLTWSYVGGVQYSTTGTLVAFTGVGASPSNDYFVFGTGGVNATGCMFRTFQVTGINTTTPVNAANTVTGAYTNTTDATLNYNSATAAAGVAIAAFLGTQPAALPKTGWTESIDQVINLGAEIQYLIGSDTSVEAGFSSAASGEILAFELVDADAGGGGSTISATLADHVATLAETFEITLWLNRIVSEVAGTFNDALTFTVNNAAPVVTTVTRAIRSVRNRVLRLTRPWSRKVR